MPTYLAIGDHTEALRVEFDPSLVSFEQLVHKFWQEHEPMAFAFTGFQCATLHDHPRVRTHASTSSPEKFFSFLPIGRSQRHLVPHADSAGRRGGGQEQARW